MARLATGRLVVRQRAEIGVRLRELRMALHGDRGGPRLARELGIPSRSWYQYEAGIAMPAERMLALILQTNVSARWLLTGFGPMFEVQSWVATAAATEESWGGVTIDACAAWNTE